MCERKVEDGEDGGENKGGGEEVCEGSRTGTASCLDLVGGCACEDIEMASDLEDGTNTVEFPDAEMYDVLPSPASLRVWGLSQEESCSWCGGHGTMRHALSACSVALASGKYRWRHDQVLAVVVEEMVQQEVMRSRKSGVEKEEEEAHGREVVFVKEGQVVRGGRRRRWKASSLPNACDWQVAADLKPQMVFPEEICMIRLWHEIVI